MNTIIWIAQGILAAVFLAAISTCSALTARPAKGARAGQAAQALQAPCRTTSCSETSSATRSDTRLIARSRPSTENGSSRPQRSHTR